MILKQGKNETKEFFKTSVFNFFKMQKVEKESKEFKEGNQNNI